MFQLKISAHPISEGFRGPEIESLTFQVEDKTSRVHIREADVNNPKITTRILEDTGDSSPEDVCIKTYQIIKWMEEHLLGKHIEIEWGNCSSSCADAKTQQVLYIAIADVRYALEKLY